MKKLILSIAILAVMTFAACSDDEKDYTPHYTICQHCDIPEEDGYEVCTGDNGNAYVGNADTGIETSHYFELFCDNVPEIPGGGTTYTNCVLCISDAHPDGVKICKGTNGNAFTFVGDTATDTGEAYATYLASQNCTSAEPIDPDPEPTAECVTCAASQTVPAPVEICKGPNGHAFVMNVDTQMDYQTYIDQYEQTAGTTCQ